MKKSLLNHLVFAIVFFTISTGAFAKRNPAIISPNNIYADTLGVNKLPFHPLWFVSDNLPVVKIVKDNDKDVKYVEDNAVVDCIRYNISTENNEIQTGKEVAFKVKLDFISELHYMWRDEDCQKLALKVVFPKGFSQTGGTYVDFTTITFDENNKSVNLPS